MGTGKIGVALIGAGATIVAAALPVVLGLVHVSTNDPKLRFPVAVLDSGAGNGAVADAEVSLNIPDVSADRTDTGGKYTFQLTKKMIGQGARLTVQKAGYDSYDQQILSLQPRDEYYRVYLKVHSSVSVSPGPELPLEVTRVYSSGAKASGAGANFSDWYTLCTTEEHGYHILRSEFRLSGDRSCNAWSECRPSLQTPAQVCWQFRMQGHNEWGGSGQALSEGTLTVVWGRQ
jgi:hypothetical protein